MNGVESGKNFASKVLPNTLSDLILLSLKELEATEADPKYFVSMGIWHWMNYDENVCYVCLAGCVMRGLGTPIGTTYPCNFDEEGKFLALDLLRVGDLKGAAIQMGLDPTGLESRYMAPYGADKSAFKEDMLQLANDLRLKGF